MRIIFSKSGDLRFISHLDLVRLLQRALRRADLPVTITKGYSPHLKMSICRALKLGIEGLSEEAIIYMEKMVAPEVFIKSLNEKLPDDIRIKRAEVTV